MKKLLFITAIIFGLSLNSFSQDLMEDFKTIIYNDSAGIVEWNCRLPLSGASYSISCSDVNSILISQNTKSLDYVGTYIRVDGNNQTITYYKYRDTLIGLSKGILYDIELSLFWNQTIYGSTYKLKFTTDKKCPSTIITHIDEYLTTFSNGVTLLNVSILDNNTDYYEISLQRKEYVGIESPKILHVSTNNLELYDLSINSTYLISVRCYYNPDINGLTVYSESSPVIEFTPITSPCSVPILSHISTTYYSGSEIPEGVTYMKFNLNSPEAIQYEIKYKLDDLDYIEILGGSDIDIYVSNHDSIYISVRSQCDSDNSGNFSEYTNEYVFSTDLFLSISNNPLENSNSKILEAYDIMGRKIQNYEQHRGFCILMVETNNIVKPIKIYKTDNVR